MSSSPLSPSSVMSQNNNKKKKRKYLLRRKRTLDQGIIIDYKNPDILKRFVTDRGKIIPRRIKTPDKFYPQWYCASF